MFGDGLDLKEVKGEWRLCRAVQMALYWRRASDDILVHGDEDALREYRQYFPFSAFGTKPAKCVPCFSMMSLCGADLIDSILSWSGAGGRLRRVKCSFPLLSNSRRTSGKIHGLSLTGIGLGCFVRGSSCIIQTGFSVAWSFGRASFRTSFVSHGSSIGRSTS